MLQDAEGNIFGRGSQDMICVLMQYLEAIWNLKSKSFQPLCTLYLSSVPEEETVGHMGQESSLPPQSSKKSM